MKIEDLLRVIRSLFYIWVAIESFLLWYIYSQGYQKIKKSSIIHTLQNIFLFIALYFIFLSFIPIIQIFNMDASLFILNFNMVFLILISYSMYKFRNKSLKEDKMELPKKE